MTSGSFTSFPLASIVINREERQRRVLDRDHIVALSESINKRGLIHPPVLRRDGTLVVGECRVEAVRNLGWTHVPIQFIDELDDRVLRAVELEENVRRKNLEWKEECLAVKEYHDLKKAEEPSWSMAATGEELGYSERRIEERLQVAKEILNGNSRVLAAPKMSTATGIVRRATDRAKTMGLVAIAESIAPPADSSPIITGNFLEWAPTYTGPKFNFIHCDFPYGIGADKFVQGAAPTHGGYEDKESTYHGLISCLLNNLDRLCDQSCHFMFWFSMHYYAFTRSRFADADIILDPFPLVWVKSDNIGIIPDPERGPRRVYETAFFGSLGDRRTVSPVSNAVALPTVRDEHMSIKPQEVLQHFFRMFCDQSTIMLDPTCGSGSSLRAALALNSKSVTGLEINPEFAERARLQLKLQKVTS